MRQNTINVILRLFLVGVLGLLGCGGCGVSANQGSGITTDTMSGVVATGAVATGIVYLKDS